MGLGGDKPGHMLRDRNFGPSKFEQSTYDTETADNSETRNDRRLGNSDFCKIVLFTFVPPLSVGRVSALL